MAKKPLLPDGLLTQDNWDAIHPSVFVPWTWHDDLRAVAPHQYYLSSPQQLVFYPKKDRPQYVVIKLDEDFSVERSPLRRATKTRYLEVYEFGRDGRKPAAVVLRPMVGFRSVIVEPETVMMYSGEPTSDSDGSRKTALSNVYINKDLRVFAHGKASNKTPDVIAVVRWTWDYTTQSEEDPEGGGEV